MTDSLDRLYRKILAAREADASASRTARLFRRGRTHMAKKLGEEAVEVVIDAVADDADAVVRESADLMYNLAVLWAACDIRPSDVWAEMERRDRLFGIAEKMPKSARKTHHGKTHQGKRPSASAEKAKLQPVNALRRPAGRPNRLRKHRFGSA